MSNKRPGMMIYFEDWEDLVVTLDDQRFHMLFTCLFDTARGNQVVLPDDLVVTTCYHLMEKRLRRDIERYEKTVEKRRAASKLGVEARKNTTKPDHVVTTDNQMVTNGNQANPTITVTPTVTPTETVTVTGNSLSPIPSLTDEEERGTERERIPQISDILNYAWKAGHGWVTPRVAKQFVSVQEARGWTDSVGNSIRDWRAWFDGWLLQYKAGKPAGVKRAAAAGDYEQRSYSKKQMDELFRESFEEG